MADYNKILLMGRLTRDPQLNFLPSNTPVVEIGLASSRRFRRQDGTQGEETLFVDCRAFGRTAELVNQYFTKGRPIFIEGRLQLDQWEDKEGNRRSKHRVFIESFSFIDARDNKQQKRADGQETGYSSDPTEVGSNDHSISTASTSAHDDVDDDDIPF